MKAFRAHGLGQFSRSVAMRPHLGRSPIAQPAVVHGKSIVMLRHWHYVFRASLFEQGGPGSRIVMFGLEHGYEVLIAEFVLSPVGGDVVLLFLESLPIHTSWIPFVA